MGSAYVKEVYRSFHTSNIGSVGQRAAKLLTIKVGVPKKESANLAFPAEVFASMIGPSSRLPRVRSFSKFDGRQFCRHLT